MKKRDESLPPREQPCPSCGASMIIGDGDECQRCGELLVKPPSSIPRSKPNLGIVVGLIPSVASFVLFVILNGSSGNQMFTILLVVLIILAGSTVGGWLTSAISVRGTGRILLAALFGFGYALLAVAVFFVTCVSQFKL